MRTVCVNSQWASVRREGRLLLVARKGEPPSRFRVNDLDQLVLMGNITLTPTALDLIMEKGVDTVFLTSTGRYRGRILSGTSSNITLRLAQFQKLTGKAASSMAQAIVKAKCTNQRIFLQRFARRHGATQQIAAAIISIRAAMERNSISTTLDEIRGCEGSAAAAYFRAFDDLILTEGFHFSGRNRRPPMDPVNAILSFCYTLLFNTVESLVRIVGLDPYLGALHAPLTGRPSLVCDLVEEFRTPVVDALIVAAINKKRIHPEDFENPGPGEPVIIRKDALTAIIKLFNSRLESKTLYPPQGIKLKYRDIIEQQIRHLARCILHKPETPNPTENKEDDSSNHTEKTDSVPTKELLTELTEPTEPTKPTESTESTESNNYSQFNCSEEHPAFYSTVENADKSNSSNQSNPSTFNYLPFTLQ